MVSSNGTSVAEAAQAGNDTLLNIRCMLASIHHEDDIDRVLDAGITEACFAGVETCWEVFQYICNRLRSGKKISKKDIQRAYDVDLPEGADDPTLYSGLVVRATAVAQVESVLTDMIPWLEGKLEVDDEEFYASIRTTRNRLRDVAAPGSVENGQVLWYKGAIDAPPPLKWVVRGLVPDKWATFFYGAGGSAKSYLAVYLALAVATGGKFLGIPASKMKVLYLDWEMDEETFRQRICLIAKGLGMDVSDGIPNLGYKRLHRPLKEHLDDIIEQCEDNDTGLLIIDSFGFSMTGMDTNAQADVTAQMARIAQIPAASVIIDHISKRGKGEEGPFGSVYKKNASRWMWWCRAASKEASPDGEVKPGIFVRMWNAKHNIAAQQDDIFLHIVWDDEFTPTATTIDRVRPESVPASLTDGFTREEQQVPELSPTQVEVLDAIAAWPEENEGPAPQEYVCEFTGLTPKTVIGIANSLRKLGEITYANIRNGHEGRPSRGYSLAKQTPDLDTTEEEEKL